MRPRRFALDASICAAVTFVVAVVVTYLYNLAAHGSGRVDWGTAVELAVVFGIVLPLMLARNAGSDAGRTEPPAPG